MMLAVNRSSRCCSPALRRAMTSSRMRVSSLVVGTMRMIAERTYVLGFECCLLAAHFELGVPTT